MRTIEVEIDSDGRIHPLQPTHELPRGRALLSWPTSWPTSGQNEAYVLSQAALAEDWLRPEEDEAWAHLQPDK